MTTIHCKPNDPAVAAILARTWPGTSHRDIGVTIYETGGMPLTSCWEGGRCHPRGAVDLHSLRRFRQGGPCLRTGGNAGAESFKIGDSPY